MDFPGLARDYLARKSGLLLHASSRLSDRAAQWQLELEDGPMGVECDVRDSAFAARIRRALGARPLQHTPCPALELRIEKVATTAATAAAAREGRVMLPANLDFYVPTAAAPVIPRELSLARQWRAGVELSVSRDRRRMEDFYETLYLPTLARTNPEGRASPLRELARLGPGWLMSLLQAGRLVAGGLVFESPLRPNEGWLSHLGYVAEAPAFIRAAPYVAAFELSRRFGFGATDLLAALPILSDGLAQHKLSWGSHVRSFASHAVARSSALRLTFTSTQALIRFCRTHPVVMLTHVGLVVLTSGGYLGRLPPKSPRVDVDALDPLRPLADLTRALHRCSASLPFAAG